MSKKSLSLRLICLCCTTLLLLLFMEQTTIYGSNTGELKQGRSDTILINLPTIPGGEQMPGVEFLHDLHTEQVKENDCSVCHLKDDERFVFKFKRLKDTTTETDMAIYHDNCISCHDEAKRSGKQSGPLKAQCRDCHSTKSFADSTWSPIDFDKSLHYRHEKAKNIVGIKKVQEPTVSGEKEPNCGACHHSYDEKTEKIFYEKGKEDSCFYCHKDVKIGKADSMRNVSHDSCVNCHLVEMKNFAGPINCKGCHDIEQRKKIEKLQDVPRLKREQPDVTIMAGWSVPSAPPADSASTSSNVDALKPEELNKIVKTHMKPVAFNHQEHEKSSKNCRTCHHGSLDSCKECHTVAGNEKGAFVKLEKVMHDPKSDNSCIGCHNNYKKLSDCAGCHSQMPSKSFADNDKSCSTCHEVDAEALNLVSADAAAISETAAKIVQGRNSNFKKVADDKIPERINIGYISDKYEASDFPHKKVINSIKKRIEKSGMAQTFHGDETTLCMGCHHNSLPTETPQKCGSCHGKTEAVKGDGRPGLKGAYHGQCIACHQNMKIETVAATDCNKCHKEKK